MQHGCIVWNVRAGFRNFGILNPIGLPATGSQNVIVNVRVRLSYFLPAEMPKNAFKKISTTSVNPVARNYQFFKGFWGSVHPEISLAKKYLSVQTNHLALSELNGQMSDG